MKKISLKSNNTIRDIKGGCSCTGWCNCDNNPKGYIQSTTDWVEATRNSTHIGETPWRV